ncbi:creatininase family protein [bacterium]|nr:creatininase family protein [bacterium]MBU1072460.1 creatininase family protein [bacterium]MBU1676038.1 creatininase family protein [bacterium]
MSDNPLAPLLVWDRLEVGPARIEARRISAQYTVVRPEGTESVKLSYAWEEDVLDPDDPVDRNLASLILAQVALNYGLFCRRMVLHGAFDERDRRFLADMAANTSREIYVNRFLKPNPFLVEPATKLPVVRAGEASRAELVFPDAVAEDRQASWGGERGACCVLSSGGKDSLLSYGLLAELGVETHPVFVNESGRHWFTALNAHRHFREHVPDTGRVWTDCDRVFSWMLRRLPFVRPDFAKVRADIYPVRLWTVAVFLFGALPLLRKRGIDRLVIGDEFDTSRRVRHRGLTHYDGLYDQSRWFDLALSRYFQRKSWRVHQFSLLRHLSELLIEKILVERYPDLQRLQVSCHAAHKDEDSDRVLPCGKCEKCRRIVGMLAALGADPQRCGYAPKQIEDALQALHGHDVKQESAGSDQMILMLHERGLWRTDEPLPDAHPEVLQVRLDKDRAPLGTMPSDLRGPVLRLCLQHADGAVIRHGRVWLPCDPFDEPDFNTLSPFENRRRGAASENRQPWLLAELTWPEAEQRFHETDIVLLPVGAIEQHGPHLPLDVDAFDADWLARRVAASCTDPKPLVLPLIPYGVSYHHEDFVGTLSMRNETMAQLVYDVGMGAARCGATKLVIVNGHGGNGPALHFAAQMINRDARIFTCVESGETSDVDINALAETDNDVHAGEIETSTTLALRPELVHMDRAAPSVPRFSSRYLDFTNLRAVTWNAYTARISPNGVMGDPTRASAEKGHRMWQVMVRNLVDFVEDLKSLTLDEIHQRRY